jgi:hypothetical protein
MFLEDRLNHTTVLLPHEFLPGLDSFDIYSATSREAAYLLVIVGDVTMRKNPSYILINYMKKWTA